VRIVVFGDSGGVSQLLELIPVEQVVGIVGASIRPQYTGELKEISNSINVPFLCQPKWMTADYNKFVTSLECLMPDILWINSYSMIIRPDVLAIPKRGCLNIHGALLPKNRGSNPIQWAIINRQWETGVTLHEVDAGLDSGPIIDQISVPIALHHRWFDIRDQLIEATSQLIERNVATILSANWKAESQNEKEATFGKRRTADDGKFAWTDPLIDIFNKIRALLPPIPPAFYLDELGEKQFVAGFMSLGQLAIEKSQRFDAALNFRTDTVHLLPLIGSEGINELQAFSPEQHANDRPWFHGEPGSEEVDFIPFALTSRTSGQQIARCVLSDLDLHAQSLKGQIWWAHGIENQEQLREAGMQLLQHFVQMELGAVHLDLTKTEAPALAIRENS
jgi:methionyl-tRNA formyltransferase